MAGNINWATLAPSTALASAVPGPATYAGPLARDPRVPLSPGDAAAIPQMVAAPAAAPAATPGMDPAAARLMAILAGQQAYSGDGAGATALALTNSQGGSGIVQGLGAMAHMAAPAPKSGAQAAAPIVAAAPKTAGQEIGDKVTALAGHDHIPLAALGQLAGLTPLYKTPLDARNLAGMGIIESSRAVLAADLQAAGDDAAKQSAAHTKYITSLRDAMGDNPLMNQAAYGMQAAQGAN